LANGAPAFYQAYWTELRELLAQAPHPFAGLQQPPAQADYHFAIGGGGVRLNAVANLANAWVAVELYTTGPNAQPWFDSLSLQRAAIEAELGTPLCWEPQVPNGHASRIRARRSDCDFDDPADRRRQQVWIVAGLIGMRHVFVPRLRALRD
jgi:hypothetical protein